MILGHHAGLVYYAHGEYSEYPASTLVPRADYSTPHVLRQYACTQSGLLGQAEMADGRSSVLSFLHSARRFTESLISGLE